MQTSHERLKLMSPETFAHLGEGDLVYIKSVQQDGVPSFAVHAANGRELAVFDSWEAALSTALENNMSPASLH